MVRKCFDFSAENLLLFSLPRIVVIDEAIIDADPLTVFRALIDEVNGRTHWWMPSLEAKPRGEKPFGQAGSVIDITVHVPGTTKITTRITEVIEGRAMTWENFEGDYLGKEEWTFEPVAFGKTRVKSRWDVVPNRLLYRIFWFMAGRVHSRVMQAGFTGMNRYLTRRQP